MNRSQQALLVSLSSYLALASGHNALRGNTAIVDDTGVVQRGLASTGGIPECKKSVAMRVDLFPAVPAAETVAPPSPSKTVYGGKSKMKQFAAAASTPASPNTPRSPNTPARSTTSATLTFCLDRIFLDLDYVVGAGTTITSSEIDCAHVNHAVSFFSGENAVAPPVSESRFFASGMAPSQAMVDNADVLRILADGNSCEFRVTTAGAAEAPILVGTLGGDVFNHDVVVEPDVMIPH